MGIYGERNEKQNRNSKAQVDNLSTNLINNKFQTYFDKLDAFAQTLADITDKYIKTGTDSYIYGEAASDDDSG